MLQLINIHKDYVIGDTVVKALNDVSLEFSYNGFVSILGPSGCGKTTLLNIIGGLDRYTSGDLIINGKSTESFSDYDWDSYRNNSIGFVFQQYNLIPHLNVLENVELALTLSGFSDKTRKQKAKSALDKVGLSDQYNKRPNQLSGGQMQRVAIARALVNDPDIILADEPTGALDSVTSIQIMELLKEIAAERLVIMVTHNAEIARKYSTRTIKLLDGKVISDEAASENAGDNKERAFISSRSSMSYLTSIKLSFKNLLTKRTRAIITSFAGSIGIIGIALVLAISSGFSKQIAFLEANTLAAYPIEIEQGQTIANLINSGNFSFMRDRSQGEEFPDTEDILVYNPQININLHTNEITDDYLDYLKAMDESLYNTIAYTRNITMNLLNEVNGNIVRLNTRQAGWQEIIADYDFLNSQYDLLKGAMPSEKTHILLVIDSYNRLNIDVINALGLPTQNVSKYTIDDFLEMEFKLIPNDVYYSYNEETGLFNANSFNDIYDSEEALTLEIVGVVRSKPGSSTSIMNAGLVYPVELTDYVMNDSASSQVAVKQSLNENKGRNVIDGSSMTATQLKSALRALGVDPTPSRIRIYPVSINSKEKIKEYLDAYNEGKRSKDIILFMDFADIITGTMGTIINGISYVLIAFAGISLVVSSIMIGIITYISVLERTREIGVLRSLGARKKDITRVFNAETLIIGFTAGLMGVLIAALLTIPINFILTRLATGFTSIASLEVSHAFYLIAISMALTLVSGLIPARIAAKKDPVIALRTE